jgi:Histidine kinase-, DNA gyrase B-, and HSP90-like ATPase
MSKSRNPQPPESQPRAYRMTIAGQLFKHLGLQMYSGAVPAISELISNSYDAMAKKVEVTIPFGRPISPDDQIVVKDNGFGMNLEDCNTQYLMVGRNRRGRGVEWTNEYNGVPPRKVQGRKGIGKLAGFGIAGRIGIRSVKDKVVSHFTLDFAKLTESDSFADAAGYAPEIGADDGSKTDEENGTTITLTQLKITRSIEEEQFKTGLARRLLVLDQSFRVVVNGHRVTRHEATFQFRFPDGTQAWNTASLSNGQQFQWWAGFTKEPIPDEEQRGFVVYVRGKLAQTPWFFDLSGGVHGQHGMQYLTGEVKADFLDEAVDLISTDRGTIRWEDPLAVPLRDWGRAETKRLLAEWVDKRRSAKRHSPAVSRYLHLAERLPHAERRVFEDVVDRIISIPQLDADSSGRDLADVLVEFVYNALTNRSVLDAIKQLNAASPAERQKFGEILAEWDILEAVNVAYVVKGRVAIINKFEEMIRNRVPEKPDMQDYVKARPWLIDPKWSMLAHEKALDRFLVEHFKIETGRSKEGARRLDFFCLGDKYQTAYVVEAKRPGDLVGRDEFDQLRDYVLYLRGKFRQVPDSDIGRSTVGGVLIADRVREEDREHQRSFLELDNMRFVTWDQLLTSTKTLHEQFLDAVKLRAPADDPRIQGMSSIDAQSRDSSSSKQQARKRRKRKKRRR